MNLGYMLLAILPEIGLVVLLGVVLLIDLIYVRKHGGRLGWVTFWGLIVIIALDLILVRPPHTPQLIWGSMLRFDEAGYVFSIVFMTGAAITALLSIDNENYGSRGEFYILILASTLGMTLMASSADLIMLYLAIETASIPLYVLAGFLVKDQKSVESGVKYLLFGAMSSAIMLYGFTLLYGFSGTTQIYLIAANLQEQGIALLTLAVPVVLVLVGFAFKMSVAPMHFWAPDVYEGAPSPVTGFLSTASKAAGFMVLIRIITVVFPEISSMWTVLLAVLATLSMVIGNYLALTQKNIKRLLAYSSIAQAGYILIGVATNTELGLGATMYYLIAYLVTNLAAFGIVTIVGNSIGSDALADYAGLHRRSPGLATAMLVAILSLAGIPPFAGFIGKFLVFMSAVNAGIIWLAFVGVFNAIIGLYYYLTVLKYIYLYRSEDEDKPLPVARPWATAVVLCIAGIIVIGVLVAPWYTWVGASAISFAGY
jgi:NADH-quinone oxidoreductase subunit N